MQFCSPRFYLARAAALAICTVCFSLPGHAQTGIYAAFSTSNFQSPGISRQYGPTIGLYHEMLRPPVVRIGFDARATLLGSDSHKAYMGLIGPNLRIHPKVVPLMPHVEGLLGAGAVNVGQGRIAHKVWKWTMNRVKEGVHEVNPLRFGLDAKGRYL